MIIYDDVIEFLNNFLDIHFQITGSELKKGGIQMWLYNTNPRVEESLTVTFLNTESTPVTVSQFNIYLNFKVKHLFMKRIECYRLFARNSIVS